MIHAQIVENVPEDARGGITRALMGTEPPPVIAPALQGARMPPIGVAVRTLTGAAPDVAIRELKQALPGGGARRG